MKIYKIVLPTPYHDREAQDIYDEKSERIVLSQLEKKGYKGIKLSRDRIILVEGEIHVLTSMTIVGKWTIVEAEKYREEYKKLIETKANK